MSIRTTWITTRRSGLPAYGRVQTIVRSAPERTRAAAVDIGTNSTRLLIAESSEGTTEALIRLSTVTALGRGSDRTGRLSAEAIGRTVSVLATYGEMIRDAGVVAWRAVATSASRDATNGHAFLDEAEAVLGFRADIISGTEEAALSFLGATSVSPTADIVIDTGGGSTEFVSAAEAVSVDIGSVRLTERCLPHLPASPMELNAARTEAARVIATRTLPLGRNPIGVAGTWTSLAAMHLELDSYDADLVEGTLLTLDDVRRLVNWLSTLSLSEVESIPSLDPQRAPVILGGAVVAEASLQALALDRVTVSEHDILDGVCLDLLAGPSTTG